MDTYLLTLTSVILFCLCAHQFFKSLVVSIPLYNESRYTKGALRVAKGYKIFSWGLMTGCFLLALVISFYQVFLEI